MSISGSTNVHSFAYVTYYTARIGQEQLRLATALFENVIVPDINGSFNHLFEFRMQSEKVRSELKKIWVPVSKIFKVNGKTQWEKYIYKPTSERDSLYEKFATYVEKLDKEWSHKEEIPEAGTARLIWDHPHTEEAWFYVADVRATLEMMRKLPAPIIVLPELTPVLLELHAEHFGFSTDDVDNPSLGFTEQTHIRFPGIGKLSYEEIIELRHSPNWPTIQRHLNRLYYGTTEHDIEKAILVPLIADLERYATEQRPNIMWGFLKVLTSEFLIHLLPPPFDRFASILGKTRQWYREKKRKEAYGHVFTWLGYKQKLHKLSDVTKPKHSN